MMDSTKAKAGPRNMGATGIAGGGGRNGLPASRRLTREAGPLHDKLGLSPVQSSPVQSSPVVRFAAAGRSSPGSSIAPLNAAAAAGGWCATPQAAYTAASLPRSPNLADERTPPAGGPVGPGPNLRPITPVHPDQQKRERGRTRAMRTSTARAARFGVWVVMAAVLGGAAFATPTEAAAPDRALLNKVRHYYASNKARQNRGYGCNWFRVLMAFGDKTPREWRGPAGCALTPYTTAEARASQKIWWGWKAVADELETLASSQVQDIIVPVTVPVTYAQASAGTLSDFYTVNTGIFERVKGYYTRNRENANLSYGCPWYQVLLAFEKEADSGIPVPHPSCPQVPMTAAGATSRVAIWSGWQEVADELERIEQARADNQPPTITIWAPIKGVDEGQGFVFELAGTTKRTADVEVAFAQVGDFTTRSLANRTVTVTKGKGTITIRTVDDKVQEDRGKITATVLPGNGYTVGSANSAHVYVEDNDPAEEAVLPVIEFRDDCGRSTQGAHVTAAPGVTNNLFRCDFVISGSTNGPLTIYWSVDEDHPLVPSYLAGGQRKVASARNPFTEITTGSNGQHDQTADITIRLLPDHRNPPQYKLGARDTVVRTLVDGDPLPPVVQFSAKGCDPQNLGIYDTGALTGTDGSFYCEFIKDREITSLISVRVEATGPGYDDYMDQKINNPTTLPWQSHNFTNNRLSSDTGWRVNRTDDGVYQPNKVVTVTILPDTNVPPTYTVGARNTATREFKDADTKPALPQITSLFPCSDGGGTTLSPSTLFPETSKFSCTLRSNKAIAENTLIKYELVGGTYNRTEQRTANWSSTTASAVGFNVDNFVDEPNERTVIFRILPTDEYTVADGVERSFKVQDNDDITAEDLQISAVLHPDGGIFFTPGDILAVTVTPPKTSYQALPFTVTLASVNNIIALDVHSTENEQYTYHYAGTLPPYAEQVQYLIPTKRDENQSESVPVAIGVSGAIHGVNLVARYTPITAPDPNALPGDLSGWTAKQCYEARDKLNGQSCGSGDYNSILVSYEGDPAVVQSEDELHFYLFPNPVTRGETTNVRMTYSGFVDGYRDVHVGAKGAKVSVPPTAGTQWDDGAKIDVRFQTMNSTRDMDAKGIRFNNVKVRDNDPVVMEYVTNTLGNVDEGTWTKIAKIAMVQGDGFLETQDGTVTVDFHVEGCALAANRQAYWGNNDQHPPSVPVGQDIPCLIYVRNATRDGPDTFTLPWGGSDHDSMTVNFVVGHDDDADDETITWTPSFTFDSSGGGYAYDSDGCVGNVCTAMPTNTFVAYDDEKGVQPTKTVYLAFTLDSYQVVEKNGPVQPVIRFYTLASGCADTETDHKKPACRESTLGTDVIIDTSTFKVRNGAPGDTATRGPQAASCAPPGDYCVDEEEDVSIVPRLDTVKYDVKTHGADEIEPDEFFTIEIIESELPTGFARGFRPKAIVWMLETGGTAEQQRAANLAEFEAACTKSDGTKDYVTEDVKYNGKTFNCIPAITYALVTGEVQESALTTSASTTAQLTVRMTSNRTVQWNQNPVGTTDPGYIQPVFSFADTTKGERLNGVSTIPTAYGGLTADVPLEIQVPVQTSNRGGDPDSAKNDATDRADAQVELTLFGKRSQIANPADKMLFWIRDEQDTLIERKAIDFDYVYSPGGLNQPNGPDKHKIEFGYTFDRALESWETAEFIVEVKSGGTTITNPILDSSLYDLEVKDGQSNVTITRREDQHFLRIKGLGSSNTNTITCGRHGSNSGVTQETFDRNASACLIFTNKVKSATRIGIVPVGVGPGTANFGFRAVSGGISFAKHLYPASDGAATLVTLRQVGGSTIKEPYSDPVNFSGDLQKDYPFDVTLGLVPDGAFNFNLCLDADSTATHGDDFAVGRKNSQGHWFPTTFTNGCSQDYSTSDANYDEQDFYIRVYKDERTLNDSGNESLIMRLKLRDPNPNNIRCTLVDHDDDTNTAEVCAATSWTIANPDVPATVYRTLKVVPVDPTTITEPANTDPEVKDGLYWKSHEDHAFDLVLDPAPTADTTTSFQLCTTDDTTASYYHDLRIVDAVEHDNGAVVGGQAFDRHTKCTRTMRTNVASKRYYLRVHADSHDEGKETFEVYVKLNNPNPDAVRCRADGNTHACPVTTWTISNDGPLPAAWLARFGRTVAQQALDGIAGRLTAPRTPGAQGTIAGQPFTLRTRGADGPAPDTLAPPALARGFDADGGRVGLDGVAPPGVGNGPPAQQTLTLRNILLGSSFTATGQPDAHGGSFAFWGRAAQANFDGREGAVALDGEVTTGLLGVDYARDQWLVGVSLLQSTGTGGYDDTGSSTCPAAGSVSAELRTALCQGAGRAGHGAVETTLTAAVPYASLQAAERLQLWGAAGYGWGDIRLETGRGEALRTDVTWSMATLGLRGQVLAPADSGPALAVTSDALWAGTDSEQIRGLEASDSDVTRLRLGLEGSWLVRLDTLGQLTPTLAVGARHDGGDAETGFGVELGGGLAWNAPRFGLALNLEGRTLLTHRDEDFQDQGVAASFAFDPDPATPRGPSLTVRQDWGGRATGGVDALFAAAPLTQRPGTAATRSRWAAEAAWGFPAFEGRFTGSPHLGVGLAPGTRDYSLGWRLVPATTASALALDLQATRRERDAAQPEHTVGIEITTRW